MFLFDPADLAALVLRTVNAAVWTIVAMMVFREHIVLSRLARRLISVVITAGMWVLAFGSLVALGAIEGTMARTVYTAFTAFALIIGLAVATTAERRVDSDRDVPKR